MIWQMWSRAYLPQWYTRTTEKVEQYRTLSEGDLVRLIDDSVKSCAYKMARVVGDIPSKGRSYSFSDCQDINWDIPKALGETGATILLQVFSREKQCRRCSCQHTK